MKVGQRFTSGTYRMEEDRIKSFAAEFDPGPFHLDEAAAQASLFKGLAASGCALAAAAMSLLIKGGLPFASRAAGLGGEIEWPRPTRPGDTLHVESEIKEIIPSRSKPNQGIVESPQHNAKPKQRTRPDLHRKNNSLQTPDANSKTSLH